MVLVALSGLATTALLMFAGAARHVPFTLLGPMQYIVPTINFLLGVFLYHEPLAASQLIGFVLVWVGLIIFTIDGVGPCARRRRSRARYRGDVTRTLLVGLGAAAVLLVACSPTRPTSATPPPA